MDRIDQTCQRSAVVEIADFAEGIIWGYPLIDVVKGTIEDAAKGTLRRNGEVSAGRAHEWLDVAGAATGVLTYEGHLARVLEEGRNKVAARETRRRDETIEIFALEGVFFIKDMNVDSNLFRYEASLWLAGRTPYLDFYDHKGLYHVAVDALGLLIGGGSRYGIFALEILVSCLNLYFLARSVRLIEGHAFKQVARTEFSP